MDKRVRKVGKSYIVEIFGYDGIVVLQEIAGDGAEGEFRLPGHIRCRKAEMDE